MIEFLKKCQSILDDGGLIVIKDNHTSTDAEDPDMNDSSITRPYWKFIELFEQAGLDLVLERKQVRFPKGLYPVKMFALK